MKNFFLYVFLYMYTTLKSYQKSFILFCDCDTYFELCENDTKYVYSYGPVRPSSTSCEVAWFQTWPEEKLFSFFTNKFD